MTKREVSVETCEKMRLAKLGRTGELSNNWKGGRIKIHGYIKIQRPKHRRADSGGYVLEHWLKYEKYHKCCLLHWAVVHHEDEDRTNNSKKNLIAFSGNSKHTKLHHVRKRQKILSRGLVCPYCNSTYVAKHGTVDNLRKLQCRNCYKNWQTTKDDYTRVYSIRDIICEGWDRKCPLCGNIYVKRKGIMNNKQRFQCTTCREGWYGPTKQTIQHYLTETSFRMKLVRETRRLAEQMFMSDRFRTKLLRGTTP